MLVHSLWDQEDIYGAPAVWKAIKPKDTGNDKVFLVLGPWYHSQEIHDGSALGAIRFDSDTALSFRREILRPFLDQYLKAGRAEGRHRARHGLRDGDEHVAAPAGVARRLRERLHAEARRRSTSAPARGSASKRRRPATRSSPSTSRTRPKPVPFIRRARHSRRATTADRAGASGWSTDQRDAASRPGRR